eukprot:352218-Chlamydomonas_euryale.AAC.3
MDEIMHRTARAMASEGKPFRGTLFAGLMIKDGKAKLLEHNVRFGDPECQSLMARLDSDLGDAMLSAAERKLDKAVAGGPKSLTRQLREVPKLDQAVAGGQEGLKAQGKEEGKTRGLFQTARSQKPVCVMH